MPNNDAHDYPYWSVGDPEQMKTQAVCTRALKRQSLALLVFAVLLFGVPSSQAAKPGPATPQLVSVSPSYGAPGTSVELLGSGFGAKRTGSLVSFGGVDATVYSSWSDTRIVAEVPVGAARGDAVVTVDRVASTGLPFVPWGPPTLSSLTPSRASAGQTMTLSGSGFGTVQSDSVVSVSGLPATVTSWSDTSISILVPDVGSGAVTVDRGGLISNAIVFERAYGPAIASLSASSGLIGSTITINGTGFEAVQGSGQVTFGGAPATITSWSDTAITAVVPSSGPVVVTQNGVASNAVSFDAFLAPQVSSISPSRAVAGTVVTIDGVDFGSAQGSGGVSFGAVSGNVVTWTDTRIEVTVPDVADCSVTVIQNGQTSNAVPFQRIYAPTITSLSPSSAPVGSTVIISGSGFEAAQGSGQVTFGGTPATINSWSDTEISVVAPSAGTVVVSQNGLSSNAVAFGVTAYPQLVSVAPSSGRAGDVVALTGSNFGTVQGSGTVTFSGIEAVVLTWSDTEVVVEVPDAGSGPVIVSQDGLASNAVSFTRNYESQITHLSVSSGAVGSTIDVLGAGFGDVQGLGTVTFDGVPATVVTWSDTLVSVVVPGSGPVVVNQYGSSSNSVAFTAFNTPVVDALSGTTGAYDSEVVITGSSFEATQGTGFVTFAGVDAEIVSWSDSSITAKVPNAPEGPVVVTQHDLASNGIQFQPFGLPVVASLSRTAGQVGDSITVAGAYFGTDPGSVTLGGVALPIVSWTDTSIQVSIPSGSASGDIVVHAAKGDSNAVAFKVFIAPQVVGVEAADPATPLSDGDTFMITGTNFENTQGTGWVTWAGVRSQVVSWSDTAIVAIVPDGAPAGYIGVWQNGVCSNGTWRQFSPNIDTISTSVAVVGDSVTITGSDFGAAQTTRSRVAINGVSAEIVSWSDTSIVFRVPEITQAGYVGVYRDGIGSNGKYLIPAPRLTSLSAMTLQPGQQLTIYGQGFGAVQASGCIVKIGGVEVPVVSWTDTAIVVTVTEQAQTGYVGVYREWASSNGLWFLPAYSPQISSVSTSTASIGDVVTITGDGFYAQTAGSKVTLNGASVPILSWTPTQITFSVPADATSGLVGVWNYGLCSNGLQLDVVAP